ncbi:hypothetical protein MTR67_019139 [Solanum verrucosum]|uniref:Uncharacterized protein n=1 Tax=Solanum verrucosum TaxID=315347 RepID=A0AAF0QKZ1_SOLVR|nr:hypothetical protein MTR67_019139 [Solanum verrucosum]
MALTSPKVLVCVVLKEKIKLAMKMRSQRVAEQFREATPYRPMIQNAKLLGLYPNPFGWVILLHAIVDT